MYITLPSFQDNTGGYFTAGVLSLSDLWHLLEPVWVVIFFFFFFKMAFGWESVIESGPNMSWLSLYFWGAGLVSMQVSLVFCVHVSDKPALPAKGQHLCLCWLIVTSMASCQWSDFFYLVLPENRQWRHCCWTFTAISRCHDPEWLWERLWSFYQKHTIH